MLTLDPNISDTIEREGRNQLFEHYSSRTPVDIDSVSLSSKIQEGKTLAYATVASKDKTSEFNRSQVRVELRNSHLFDCDEPF